MHFFITLYVAYLSIHRLRYLMYIGYNEYTYVYPVWTYQLIHAPILCISNNLLYVYMQIPSVLRHFFFFFFLCSAKIKWVYRLCFELFYIELITIYYGYPVCYMITWIKKDSNKPQFIPNFYIEIKVQTSPKLSYMKRHNGSLC